MNNRKLLVSILAGLLAFLMVFGLIAGILPSLVKAEPSLGTLKEQLAELEKNKDDLDAQLEELRGQLYDNLGEMEKIVKEKSRIDQEIALMQRQVATINEQVSAYNLLIADKQEELTAAQERLKELNEQNRVRIRAMEENGQLSYWSVLFQANSFSDLLDRLKMIEEIAKSDRRRMEEMSEAAKEVADAKASMEAEKEALEKTKDELKATQDLLLVKRAEADQLLADLIARGDEFKALIEESEDKQDALLEEILNKEDEVADAEFQQWLSTSVPSGNAGDSNTVGGITWLLPMSYGRISSPFGPRVHPITGEKGKMHNGVDMTADIGTPIYATRSGYVDYAGYEEDGAGHWVRINHGDGYKSVYMHMDYYIVYWGQYVSAGQLIGYCGTSGGSTGPHLHFGISYYGEYKNPALYIPI